MASRQAELAARSSSSGRSRIHPRNKARVAHIDSRPVKKIECVALGSLKPPKRNARTHSQKQIRQIAKSILKFGWVVPIIVDEDGNIIAGVGRYEAAKLLGLTHVPVIVVTGLSAPEKRALMLADNKIAANAGWDRAILAAEFSELAELLPEHELDLEITGFETAEIDSILADFADPNQDPADDIPPIEPNSVCRSGDIWQLGKHRLICGDALNMGDFKALMGRQRATMVIADAPYNVKIKSIQGRGRTKHREFLQGSGEFSSAEFRLFLQTACSNMCEWSTDGALHFLFMDWRHAEDMLAAGRNVYSELKNLIAWIKTNSGMGSLYRSQHELVFLFKNGDGVHVNNVELGKHGRNRTNVWTYAGVNAFRDGRMDELSAHPTAKPVAMIADAMLDCSRRGDIVLDAFVGSGTTIIAAERVGRRCFGLELDPLYTDVAVRRWQAFTKRDAILAETGETFDDLQEARTSAKPTRRTK